MTRCREFGAGVESERAVRVSFPKQLIDRALALLVLHFGNNQTRRVAIVKFPDQSALVVTGELFRVL